MIAGRRIVLGVSGSIAAFKGVALASQLVKAGASVDVVMTPSARRFIAPLSFRAITGRPVLTELWDEESSDAIGHVALGRAADLIVIAPATAATIARLAHGMADDALGATVLASTAPLLIAPAMEPHMWAAAATVENVTILRRRGAIVMEPGEGRLASGQIGRGRLPEPEEIVDAIAREFEREQDLMGRHVVVTAGGTREAIDPVRFIGNRSSGKMGVAVAEQARRRGARVTLIHGPLQVALPAGVEAVAVESTREMEEAIHSAVRTASALVMAAAPADFRPSAIAGQKIKRRASVTLDLVPNPDILARLADWRGIKVGFAAETDDVIENARAKVTAKRVDLIVANDVSEEGSGFGTDTNRVTFVFPDGRVESRPLQTKSAVADDILDLIVGLLALKEVVQPSST